MTPGHPCFVDIWTSMLVIEVPTERTLAWGWMGGVTNLGSHLSFLIAFLAFLSVSGGGHPPTHTHPAEPCLQSGCRRGLAGQLVLPSPGGSPPFITNSAQQAEIKSQMPRVTRHRNWNPLSFARLWASPAWYPSPPYIPPPPMTLLIFTGTV